MDPTSVNGVLELLYDRAGRPVWTDELVSASGGDRVTLEPCLEALATRGHRLERSPAGVRLIRPTVLDGHLIERLLPVERIGRHVICFAQVDSTNEVAFASAAPGGEALVITAEHQRAGRGRFGRTWTSAPGSGILASVLLPAAGDLTPDGLTIAAGLAVAEGIEDAAGVAARVAWPNDVVLGVAKVAGVLVEVRPAGPARRVVVGFGINVLASPPPGDVDRPATNLVAACDGTAPERIDVCRAVLVRLDRWVADLQAGRTDQLHRRWVARCDMVNRRITVQAAGRRVTGRVLDVSPLEGLTLLTDRGRREHLSASRATVVK